jgi:hypothetical protein
MIITRWMVIYHRKRDRYEQDVDQFEAGEEAR